MKVSGGHIQQCLIVVKFATDAQAFTYKRPPLTVVNFLSKCKMGSQIELEHPWTNGQG